MTSIPVAQATDGVPTYLGVGDPAGRFADCYWAWVDKMAGDITLEGSLLNGALQGADAVRAVIRSVRELYDRQDFNFAGSWGDNGFIEDYNAEIRGRPLGAVHLITFNADGEAQHVAANYRPLNSVMFFSRLLRERLAGTPPSSTSSPARLERPMTAISTPTTEHLAAPDEWSAPRTGSTSTLVRKDQPWTSRRRFS